MADLLNCSIISTESAPLTGSHAIHCGCWILRHWKRGDGRAMFTAVNRSYNLAEKVGEFNALQQVAG